MNINNRYTMPVSVGSAIRVFLAVLIVIGIVLLCTQGFWVPKLVNYILSFDSTYQAELQLEQQSTARNY